jgi:hypothetical protein
MGDRHHCSSDNCWIAAATIAGPILAVQAQKWVERATERRRGQLQVFYWLMATRATRLSNEHVQALNRIELEFRGRSAKKKAVRDAWRLYADKLNEHVDDKNEALLTAWITSRDNLFTELVFSMSKALGFDFDRVQIMRGIYYPRGHGELEERQRNILISLERVLSGAQPIPMKVTEVPQSPEATALQATLTDKMTRAYADDGALRVRMVDTDRPSSKPV